MENIKTKENLSNTPGINFIDVENQYQDLFLLDKQIADESNGLLLPLESPEELRKYLIEDHSSTNFLINDEHGDHAGYFSFYDKDAKTSELLNIGVLKDFQGKGFAQQMMQDYFDKNKDKELFILVTKPNNAQAIRFYEKLGYKITEFKKDYYGEGEDRVLLEKRNNIK